MKKRIFNKNIAAITFATLFIAAVAVTLVKNRQQWEFERLSMARVSDKINF